MKPTRSPPHHVRSNDPPLPAPPILQIHSIRLRGLVPFGGDDFGVEDGVGLEGVFFPDGLPVGADFGLGDEVGVPVGVEFGGEGVPVGWNVRTASLPHHRQYLDG